MIPAGDAAMVSRLADIGSFGGTEHLPKLPLPGSDDPPHSWDRLRDAQSSLAVSVQSPSGTVTFLFTDIEDPTRLAEGFQHQLLEHCLKRLLSITSQKTRS